MQEHKQPRKWYSKKYYVCVSLAEPEDAGIIHLLDNAQWGERARILRNALRLYWKEVGNAASPTACP